MTRTTCNLCGAPGGTARIGRLGRYSLTCDDCEARRGLKPRNHRAEIAAGAFANPHVLALHGPRIVDR